MKEKMLEYLENYWTSGRDNNIVIEFINDFFNQYQPERSKREDPVEQLQKELIERSKLNVEIIKAQAGCGALNIVETQ